MNVVDETVQNGVGVGRIADVGGRSSLCTPRADHARASGSSPELCWSGNGTAVWSGSLSQRIELAACELLSTWGLALLGEARDDQVAVMEHCRTLLQFWRKTEERHYVLTPLRWAATQFSLTGLPLWASEGVIALMRARLRSE